MAERKTLNVNGRSRTITVDDPEMPLLYALRDEPRAERAAVRLRACAVRRLHRACRRQGGALLRHPLSKIGPASRTSSRSKASAAASKPHPVQRAFIEEQAVQCGYCINGMIMESAAFLARNKNPTEAQIKEALRQQHLPLRHPRPHRARRQARRRRSVREAIMTKHFISSRRDLLKGGGALVVSFSLSGHADSGARRKWPRRTQAARAHRGRRLPRDRRPAAW